MSLKCVVVGYDGSEPARRAFALARNLVDPEAGRVVVVSAHAARHELSARDEERLRAESEAALAELVSGVESQPGPRVETVVRDGYPQSVLTDVSREVGAEMVVVGSRGLGGMVRSLLGSVSAALVEDLELPVAVVR